MCHSSRAGLKELTGTGKAPLKGLFPVGGGSRLPGALCSSRSDDSGDISATYRVNEGDNDERGGDDLEGGKPGRILMKTEAMAAAVYLRRTDVAAPPPPPPPPPLHRALPHDAK